jgi:hypothetical protein
MMSALSQTPRIRLQWNCAKLLVPFLLFTDDYTNTVITPCSPSLFHASAWLPWCSGCMQMPW